MRISSRDLESMTYIQFREFCQSDNGCGVHSFDPLHSQSKRMSRFEWIMSIYQVVQETGEGPSVQRWAKYISWEREECDSTELVWTTRSRRGFLNCQPRRWTPRSAMRLNTAPNLFWTEVIQTLRESCRVRSVTSGMYITATADPPIHVLK